MVGVNVPLQHKVQKFSSGTGSLGWSWKKGRKMVVVWCGGLLHLSAEQTPIFMCRVNSSVQDVTNDNGDTDGGAGVDYRQLTDGQCDPLDVIKPVLSRDNVSSIAKLAPYIYDKVTQLPFVCF